MSTLLFILLQEAPAAGVETLAESAQNTFDLILKGGITMAVIGVLSIVTFYFFFERLMVIGKAARLPKKIVHTVRELVSVGDWEGAEEECEKSASPAARVLQVGIRHHRKANQALASIMENTGRIELSRLERNISVLGTISTLAPMLGFLGTVLGMIRAFQSISDDPTGVTASALSTGIYEAMVTTAGGLIVGMFAYAFYNFLVRRIAKAANHMEETIEVFINDINQPENMLNEADINQ